MSGLVVFLSLVGASAAPCPDGMARVAEFCIDRWEDTVAEVDASGGTSSHPPWLPVDGLRVVARTAPGVLPQAYIDQLQSAQACAHAGKRLCTSNELRVACRGSDVAAVYPYGGQSRVAGACNEGKGSMAAVLFGHDASRCTYAELNDPRLNLVAGGLALTGSHGACESPDGVWDVVGNLHEWTADPPDRTGHARFTGGFYGDAESNGRGCLYVTSAHSPTYHDYSTGFRCCQ